MNTVNIFMGLKNEKSSIFDQPNGKGRCCFFLHRRRGFVICKTSDLDPTPLSWFLGKVDTKNKNDTTGLKFKKEWVRKTCRGGLLKQEKAMNPNIV